MVRWIRRLFRADERRNDEPKRASSEAFDIGHRILVLGDSHVRSYAENSNFFPVFLGQGRLFNFTTDECAENYLSKAKAMNERIRAASVLLVMGEPDTRHALGYGWLPWESDVEAAGGDASGASKSVIFEELNDSVRRMKSVVASLSEDFPDRVFLIAPVYPVEMEAQNRIISEMNQLLKQCFGNVFLAAGEAMRGENLYLADRVHQSNGIQPGIEHELISRGVLETSGFRSTAVWDATEVHHRFKKNERFGCFMYDDLP